MRLHTTALLLTSALSTSKPSISLAFTSSPSLFLSKYYQLTFLSRNSIKTAGFHSLTRYQHHIFPSSRNNIISFSINRNMSASSDITKQQQLTGSGGKVALLQFEVSSSKIENQRKVQNLITSTMEQHPNIKLIVLPEIWNGPYATAAFPEYAEILPSLHFNAASNDNKNNSQDQFNLYENCPSAKILFDLAMKHNIYIIGGSISEKDNDLIYNTCLCISPNGTLVAKHRKVHLFDIDVKGGIRFKESDTLTGGDTMSVFDTGDDLFGHIGVGICYDIRFPEYALLLCQKYRCNLLVYPGAFNLTTGPAHWELLQRGRAVDNQCFVLAASPARTNPPKEGEEGKYPHYTAWGHSTVVNPWGEVIATCDEKETVVLADLNMDEVHKMRQGIPTFSQKRLDLYKVVDGDK